MKSVDLNSITITYSICSRASLELLADHVFERFSGNGVLYERFGRHYIQFEARIIKYKPMSGSKFLLSIY